MHPLVSHIRTSRPSLIGIKMTPTLYLAFPLLVYGWSRQLTKNMGCVKIKFDLGGISKRLM